MFIETSSQRIFSSQQSKSTSAPQKWQREFFWGAGGNFGEEVIY